jgi:pilus assembly protein FimV
MALGLGEMQMESFLNQPLKASVDLLNMEGLHEDEVRVRLATTEDFDKLGLDRAYFLTSVTFEVVPDGRGGAQILLRSEDPVLEPYLDFVIEARWPSGRLLREYTVLVDPPAFSQATPVVSASERVAAVEGIPAPTQGNQEFSSGQTGQSEFDYNQAVQASRQRQQSAPSSGPLAPGSQYRVSQNQTLWEIASMAKPPGASVHQTMLDIQRLNPDAFINGNINRIKAGYVIYLPSATDISSADLPSALAAVREQNQAFQEGRDDAQYAGNRPSLRISAEPEESVVGDTAGRAGATDVSDAAVAAGQPATSGADAAALESTNTSDTLARLAALEEQLQTLQRIVSLKDDQIAALQDALKEANGTLVDTAPEGLAEAEAEVAALAATDSDADTAEGSAAEQQTVESSDDSEQIAEVAPAKETASAETPPSAQPPAAPPATSPATSPATTAAPADRGWTSYLLYVLAAVVLAVGGLVFSRRRKAEEDEDEPLVQTRAPAPVSREDDVFADVQLQDPNLEVAPAAEQGNTAAAAGLMSGSSRGYGEHKHDEYASDVDAADALAEADIYVAYGRHPQAIDLLNNALSSEPSNPVYRLKLLEIYTELKDRVAATAQFKHIAASGDGESIARAETIIEGLDRADQPAKDSGLETVPASQGRGPGIGPNPLEILSGSNDSLEENFSGLEIEDAEGALDDDLDLSADFDVAGGETGDDEDLVIAADSNALSTKLDLARAYLDMGDDDGARQILDEVVAEGTDELKSEARSLLARIG